MFGHLTQLGRRAGRGGLLQRLLVGLLGLLTGLALVPPAAGAEGPPAPAAEQQVLTWKAGNSVTEYLEAPETAVAGPATVVFDNSVEAGNTTGMPHTLTFDTATPGYNHDVDLNITANPYDANGGYYEAEVVLTEGTYHYMCVIPGHGMMKGDLLVTGDGGGGEDTTAPQIQIAVNGDLDSGGDFLGAAEVEVTVTDDDSGVASVEYRLDGGEYEAYEEPVTVTELGEHTIEVRAADVAGNTGESSLEFTVVEAEPEPDPDETAPELTVEVAGEQDADGAYVGSAEVTLTATDADSGVAAIEYRLDGGEYTHYHAAVAVTDEGEHTLDARATDEAGNVAEDSVTFTVVPAGDPDPDPDPDPECPDTRASVVIDGVDTGVPNADLGDGCTINDRIDETGDYATNAAFVRHVGDVVRPLAEEGVLSQRDADAIIRAAIRSQIGR